MYASTELVACDHSDLIRAQGYENCEFLPLHGVMHVLCTDHHSGKCYNQGPPGVPGGGKTGTSVFRLHRPELLHVDIHHGGLLLVTSCLLVTIHSNLLTAVAIGLCTTRVGSNLSCVAHFIANEDITVWTLQERLNTRPALEPTVRQYQLHTATS